MEDDVKRLQQSIVPSVSARVYNSVAQTISNGTVTRLMFDSERFDVGDMHSTISNTDRLTATRSGIYLVGGQVLWQIAGTGRRDVIISHSGGGLIARDVRDATAAGVSFFASSGPWEAQAGDYFVVDVYHERGSNLTVEAEFWAILQAI
jgi:hypothetical protein